MAEQFYAISSIAEVSEQSNRILAAMGEGIIRALLVDRGLSAGAWMAASGRILRDYREAVEVVLNPPPPPNTCWCGNTIPADVIECQEHASGLPQTMTSGPIPLEEQF